ncbi:MAG: hypothetical protein ACRDIB_19330 [Ardenticatenaceae bacterium]
MMVPELEAKVRDVVDLYLNPPQNAIVPSVYDNVRHGTTTLFAALEVATGRSLLPATCGTVAKSSCASSSRSPRLTTVPLRLVWTTATPTNTPRPRLADPQPADQPALHPSISGSWLSRIVRHEVA